MSVPKKRHTRSRRGKRQSHDGLGAPNVTTCKASGLPKLPHRVCEESGYYSKNLRVKNTEERL